MQREQSVSGATGKAVLRGRYAFKVRLGKGGYGVVERYRDMLTSSYVAIKTISPTQIDESPECIAREMEIFLALECNHPNVMCLLDGFMSSDFVFDGLSGDCWRPQSPNNVAEEEMRYNALLREDCSALDVLKPFALHMVLPFMHGDLRFVLREKFATREGAQYVTAAAAGWAFQLCRGLDYLHRCHIVHRDLKPDNILVWLDPQNGASSSLRISDFGLSRFREASGVESMYMCTRNYRPPELIMTVAEEEWPIDVWSLGCILYEIVTNRILFHLDTSRDGAGHVNTVKASFQLESILDVIGTPTIEGIEANMSDHGRMSRPRRYLMNTTHANPRSSRLDALIRRHWQLLDRSEETIALWVDIISQCLCLFPQLRPTVDSLCCHPLFQRSGIYFDGDATQPRAVQITAHQPPPNRGAFAKDSWKYRIKELVLQCIDSSATRKLAVPPEMVMGLPPSPPMPTAQQAQMGWLADFPQCVAQQPALMARQQSVRLVFPSLTDKNMWLHFRSLPCDSAAEIQAAIDEAAALAADVRISQQSSDEIAHVVNYFRTLLLGCAEETEVVFQPMDEGSCREGPCSRRDRPCQSGNEEEREELYFDVVDDIASYDNEESA